MKMTKGESTVMWILFIGMLFLFEYVMFKGFIEWLQGWFKAFPLPCKVNAREQPKRSNRGHLEWF